MDVVAVTARQMPRYSAVCLSRVWDGHKDSKSMKKLINQISQNSELRSCDQFKNMEARFNSLSGSEYIEKLSVMRDKMFAHTEGVETDNTNSLKLQHYANILIKTVQLVDDIACLIGDQNGPLLPVYETLLDDSRQRWRELLLTPQPSG